MKTTLTLSAVLLSLTLIPVAFAHGAQEQNAAQATRDARGSVTVLHVAASAPDQATITRSALRGLDVELRAAVLNSLREASVRLLQLAAPVFEEASALISERRVTSGF
jgi:hypothetical protein